MEKRAGTKTFLLKIFEKKPVESEFTQGRHGSGER